MLKTEYQDSGSELLGQKGNSKCCLKGFETHTHEYFTGTGALKTESAITKEPLGSTTQNWYGVKLLPVSVSTYPVDCVHLCHLLRAQHHCLCPNGREDLPLACPPSHPHSLPSLIRDICDITRVATNYLNNQR